MKIKNILIALSLILVTPTANATLLLEENFSYTTGNELGVPANSCDKWAKVLTSNSTRKITIANDTLKYSGYESSNKGKSILFPAGSSGDSAAYNYPFTASQKNVSLYAAFMVKVQTLPANTSGSQLLFFDSGNNGTSRKGCVFVKKNANGKIVFGITKNASSDGANVAYSTKEVAINETALLVVKYVTDGSNSSPYNDAATLYVNPTVGNTEADLSTSVVSAPDNTSASDADIKGVSVRIGKYSKDILLGGLRIATTWDEALRWADATAPTLSSTAPANSATEIALNTPNITLTFNEPVKVVTGVSSTLSSSGNSDVVATSSFTTNGNSVSIPITANFLQASTTYTFTLPTNAVTDMAGNAYASAISFTFKTKSAGSLSSENAITAFKFPNQVGASIIRNDSVLVSVPFGTDLTKVKPDSIGLSANARLKAGTAQASDSANFTQVKNYTVEAENGNTRDWAVKVSILPNDKADITAFIFDGGIVTISAADTTIRIRMSDMANLVRQPTISISTNASIAGANQQYDFSSVITYVVTAENGINKKYWRVIVSDYGTATLDISRKGNETSGWQEITDNGWLSSGLGNDQNEGGRYSARFDNTGDWLLVRFDKPADKVTYRARSGSNTAPHTFTAEESADGVTYTTIKQHVNDMYASSGSYNSYSCNLKMETRYVRWIYTEKGVAGNNTNIYFDEVKITKRPLKATFTPANGTQNVAANATVKIVFEAPITSINGVAVATNLNNVKLTRVDNDQLVSTNNSLSADRKTLTLAHSGLVSAKEYTISITGTVVGDGGISGTFESATFKVASTADDVKKDITSFIIDGQKDSATINVATRTITVNVYKDCLVKTAAKSVTHNGADCELIWSKGGERCPIYYRCTANDGSYADWKVAFNFEEEENPNPKSDTCNILSFSINSHVGTIQGDTIKIANMPANTDLTALTPNIIISAKATISPSSGATQNFTHPVAYTVTAENGISTKQYVVIVTKQTTTGVESELEHQLTLYPNPVKHTLNIGLPGDIEYVELYNLQGTCVKRYADKTIEVENLPAGIYVVKICVNANTTLTRKITVTK